MNLLRVIILWTWSSFASYFLCFEDTYFQGKNTNIYAFYYYEGITGVIASLLA